MNEINTPPIDETLVAHLRVIYTLNWDGIHGFGHWMRVRANGLRLAQETGADPEVVALFALLHDARRQNDGRDPGHGARAAEFARTLRTADYIDLDDEAFAQLTYACRHHTDGLVEAHVTIQTCWDADRLDLGRVNIIPDPKLLCTEAAKRPAIRRWALKRSQELEQ
jgi:uncharacterized protein